MRFALAKMVEQEEESPRKPIELGVIYDCRVCVCVSYRLFCGYDEHCPNDSSLNDVMNYEHQRQGDEG